MAILQIEESKRHGKACAGYKRTSTIQVREFPIGVDYYLLKKQFRFTVGDSDSRAKAVAKAQEYVDSHNATA
jgi:hypothetical protein